MDHLLIVALPAEAVPDLVELGGAFRALESVLEPFYVELDVPAHRRPVSANSLTIGLEMSWQQGLLSTLGPPARTARMSPESIRAVQAAVTQIPPETLADLLTCALGEPFVAEGGRVLEISQSNPRGRWDWYEIGGSWSGHLASGLAVDPDRGNLFAGGNFLRICHLPVAIERILTDMPSVPCYQHRSFGPGSAPGVCPLCSRPSRAARPGSSPCPPSRSATCSQHGSLILARRCRPEPTCPACRAAAIAELAAADAFVDADGTWLEPTEVYDPFPLDLDYPDVPAGPDLIRLAPDLFRIAVTERVERLSADDILVVVSLHS